MRDRHTELVENQPQSAGPRLASDLPIERGDAFVHNELLLTGWALSAAGIAGVIVQIDDRLLHASYGLDTPWLADGAPELAGADRAGYRLEIDTSGWEPGRRQVTITAYDQAGGRTDIVGEVEVIPFDEPAYTTEERQATIEAGEIAMWLQQPSPTGPAVELEAPVEIAGWAYAAKGIDAVLVTLDGHARHEALHPVFRPDLIDDYGDEVAGRAGFVLRLDPGDCPPGWHHLSIVAMSGMHRAVGLETDFVCLPEPPPVEAPAPGELMPVEWLPEPRPARPRQRSSSPDELGEPGGPLHEAEARLRDEIAARVTDGPLMLDVGSDELDGLAYDDASFDVVTCSGGIGNAADPGAVLDELRRVLRTTGVLLVAAPRRGAVELERALRDRFANVRVRRQRTLLASVVADDESFAVGDGSSAIDLEVHKLGEGRPGGEDHVLAVAGDGELPDLPSMAMLAPSSATTQLRGTLRRWQDRALLAEADAAASRNQANLVRMHQEATLREWRDSQRESAALSASLADARSEAAALHAQLGERTAELADCAAQLDERTAEHAAQLEDHTARVAETEQRAQRAESTAAGQANSLSWRITRPLRSIKRNALRMARRS